MFGFTEFEVRKEGNSWVICLVAGKTVVMKSSKKYKSKDTAYSAASRWCDKMLKQLKNEDVLSLVRFAC